MDSTLEKDSVVTKTDRSDVNIITVVQSSSICVLVSQGWAATFRNDPAVDVDQEVIALDDLDIAMAEVVTNVDVVDVLRD